MLIQFDIINFYPSISVNLLLKILNFAKNYVSMKDDEFKVILTFRQSLLIYNISTWVRSLYDNFEVPMGAYDSTLKLLI